MNALAAALPEFVSRNPLPCAFCFLLLFGFTTPLCEELALTLVGMTMKTTDTGLLLVVGLAFAAILIQDTGSFFLARVLGPKILRAWPLARLIKNRALEEAERYFNRRGPSIVFSSRFVVGLRTTVRLGAGLLRMPWTAYVKFDALAAAIMIPAWLFVGYCLGAQFDLGIDRLARILGILGPVAIVAAAFLAYRGVKADKAKAEEADRADRADAA